MTLPVSTDENAIYANGPVNVARYCRGDGSDESVELRAAADEARATSRGLFMPEYLTVMVDDVVSLRSIFNIDIQGQINVGTNGRIDIGHSSHHRWGYRINIRRIEHAGSGQTNPALRTVGLKGAHVSVQRCAYWQWWADGSSVEDASVSYTTVSLGYVGHLEFVCRGAEDGSNLGWITEVSFFGGDVKKITTDSPDYNMNSISFYKTCLEGGEVRLDNVSRWRFMDARCEYGTEFWFGPKTARVVVEDAFISNSDSTSPGAVVVEDLGVENVVTTSLESHYQRRTLFSIDPETVVLDRSAEVAVTNVSPGIESFTASSINTELFDTGLIPVRGSAARFPHDTQWRISRIVFGADAEAFRPIFRFYRHDGTPAPEGEGMVSGGAHWDSTVGGYVWWSDVAGAKGRVISPDVGYMRVTVMSGVAIKPFTRFELTAYFLGPSSDYVTHLCDRRFASELAQDSTPAAGAPPVGTRAHVGDVTMTVSRREATSLTSGVAALGVEVAVKAVPVAVGDVIGITLDNGATHWARVVSASVSGGNVVLGMSDQVPSPASPGAGVRVVKWSQ